MSDKFQALLTQLKAGAMVPHWTCISQTYQSRLTTAIGKLSLPEFKKSVKFFCFKNRCFVAELLTTGLRMLVVVSCLHPFQRTKERQQAVGPAPTSCMQAQTSFPLAGLHMQALLILYIICPNQRFLTRKHSIAAPSHV